MKTLPVSGTADRMSAPTDKASEPATDTPSPDPGADGAVAEELEPIGAAPPPLPAKAADDSGLLKTTSNLPPRGFPPKTLADVMTRKIITVKESEPVGELEAWMSRFHFHHLPVVTSEMKLVGLITRTDFLHAALGLTVDGKPAEKATDKTPASAIMRRGVVTGTPDTSLAMACQVMLSEGLGCLPIVLEDATLVGIVTRTDLVKLAVDLLANKP